MTNKEISEFCKRQNPITAKTSPLDLCVQKKKLKKLTYEEIWFP